jgi:DNA-directed RNA polymerase
MKRGQEDGTALAATQAAVVASDPDFEALAARIRELRKQHSRSDRRGRRPHWFNETLGLTDRELAAAILWRVLQSRLWAQEDEGEEDRGETRELPLLLTVGTDLGADLLARYDPKTREFDIDPDAVARNLPEYVGVELLGIAESVGLIVTIPAEGRSGHRVTLAEMPFERLQRLVNGASKHVHVTTTPPVTNVKVRKPHEMLEARPSPLLRVIMATDKLQRTPWRINQRVLEVLEEAQAQGTTDEQIANIIGGGEHLRRRMTLAEARELAPLERFYWRGFLEFRGRFFQRSGTLSYTNGDDYARGLLEFASGEKLDVQGGGFGWLAWHAAQMWGHGEDKTVPFSYGIPWLAKMSGEKDLDLDDDVTSWLRQAADNCVERWQEADKPAQFLAAALALKDASEGRPVHLPVRVDATCSGVQHLALLLRDEEVARLVNLWGSANLVEDGPKPDFYEQVAKTVHGGLTQGKERTETKRVIVPKLYGAGLKTLARKLAEERRGEDAHVRKTDEDDVKAILAAAKTLARREFALLDWFGEVAKAHNEAGPLRKVSDKVKGAPVCWVTPEGAWYSKLTPTGVPVRWTTPSGFEVIQDYRYIEKDPERLRRAGCRIEILYNGRRVNLVKRIHSDRLNKDQSATSIKPNVVHSMDAALLIEIVAGSSSIDRWAVAHDAFGVPPGRVWDLIWANQSAIRALYTADRLAEWTAAWRAAGVEVPDPPEHQPELPREMWSDQRTLS